eukprot:jgi/Picsp_1/5252/NSC_02614-R1_expressed protein [Chlorella variabilis]
MVTFRDIAKVTLHVSLCFLSVNFLAHRANAAGEENGEYLEGYPFTGTVYGLTPLDPCTNFTQMQTNFNYDDGSGGSTESGNAQQTVELTNAINYTQIGAFPTPGYDYSDLPPADELTPWTGNEGSLTNAPGFLTKCWNRTSGITETDCQENCLIYYDLFNATWLNFGSLYCIQSYPTPDLTGLENPLPPDGNLSVILTNQCAMYTYGPLEGEDSLEINIVTDPWGNVYSLQSSIKNPQNESDWDFVVENATFPDGWVKSKTTLSENEFHYSYVIGNDCWIVILKDSMGNAWSQYVYGKPLEQSSFLSSFDCPALALSPSDIIGSGTIVEGAKNETQSSTASGEGETETAETAEQVSGASGNFVTLLFSLVLLAYLQDQM